MSNVYKLKKLGFIDFADNLSYSDIKNNTILLKEIFTSLVTNIEDISNSLNENEILSIIDLVEKNKNILDIKNFDHHISYIKKYLKKNDIIIVKGIVTDADKVPIPFAFLKIQNKIFQCNEKGYFKFYLENKSKYFITVFSPNYYNKKEIIFINKNLNEFEFTLRKLK